MLKENKEYRYELKFVITESIATLLKQQLAMVMDYDSHSVCKEYSYLIRSMYFDNLYSDAYYEKIDGVEYRKKYRLRMYNNDPNFLRMECKHKDGNWTYKEEAKLTLEQAQHILNKEYGLVETDNEFLKEFLMDARLKMLVPSIIVDYKRLAFTYPLSSVRITFDEELRSGRLSKDFFNPELNTTAVYPDRQLVLEVKCDRYIPEHILMILNSYPMIREAVSKFALCTEYK